MSAVSGQVDPVEPSRDEMVEARQSSKKLEKYFFNGEPALEVRVEEEGKPSESIKLPKSAVQLLYRLLDEMGKGNSVSLIPIKAELTTQQAADLLNVSRPYLIDLLEDGEIEYHKTGSHRRVKMEDLLEYKRTRKEEKKEALDNLVEQAQELDLGYTSD